MAGSAARPVAFCPDASCLNWSGLRSFAWSDTARPKAHCEFCGTCFVHDWAKFMVPPKARSQTPVHVDGGDGRSGQRAYTPGPANRRIGKGNAKGTGTEYLAKGKGKGKDFVGKGYGSDHAKGKPAAVYVMQPGKGLVPESHCVASDVEGTDKFSELIQLLAPRLGAEQRDQLLAFQPIPTTRNITYSFVEELHNQYVVCCNEVTEANQIVNDLIEQVELAHTILQECSVKADQAKSAWQVAQDELFQTTCARVEPIEPVDGFAITSLHDVSKLSSEQAMALAHACMSRAQEPTPPVPVPMQADCSEASAAHQAARAKKKARSDPGINTPDKCSENGSNCGFSDGAFPGTDPSISKHDEFKQRLHNGGFEVSDSVKQHLISVSAPAASSSKENPATAETYVGLRAAKGEYCPQGGQPY